MSYAFILAAGTFADTSIEEEHLAGQGQGHAGPVTVRLASLATPEEVAQATADADGIIVTTNPVPAESIERLGPRVRIIARAGIGLDAIDLNAAERRGIAVFHTPDYATEEVATHALALILALHRRIVPADGIARHSWREWRVLAPIVPLSQQTVGVVGCGRIGRAVIEMLRPLAGQIITFDPYVTTPPQGVELVALDDLLRRSDIVTLHTPLTEETRGMIGRRELDLLRPGAVLVNVSRGALVDQEALVEALESGQVGAAGLDVLREEPPPAEAPILRAPNVVLSPHLAWYSTASERRTRTMSIDGMIDYLEGRPPRAGRLAVVPRAGDASSAGTQT